CLMMEGRGVAHDRDGAFALFMKAAAQGHIKSFAMIGRFHENGWNRPADKAAAAQWYRRGAEAGDFRAEFYQALLMLDEGVRAAAIPLLERAIEQAPGAFCQAVAAALLGHPDPRVQAIGGRA